ncbi:hypothetical protein ACS9PB_000559 [Yersinia enterocolitica]
MRWALIKDGVVVSLILWNGIGDAYKEYTTIQLPDNSPVAPGWTLNGPAFQNPDAPPEPSNLDKYRSALAQINATLQSDIEGIKSAYITADLSNGAAQEETQNYLKELYGQILIDYLAAVSALKTQYGV